ncbi:MAG: PHP domain-containing protein [Bacteroidales bacterium]
MAKFKADLHIHTILSPCGDMEMSPANIIRVASEKGLQIIGITDHNSTLQAPLIRQLGQKAGITVLCGAEITTREEIHCLAFFEEEAQLTLFQQYLEEHLPHIPNAPEKFGYQVVVDEEENIVHEYPWLLISGLDQSLDEVALKVHNLNGLFIPAHVSRPKYSLISQLGFIPPDLEADALEISRHTTREELYSQFSYVSRWPIIQSSDAHFLSDIGMVYTIFEMEAPTFTEIRKALAGENNRCVTPSRSITEL